VLEMLLPHWGLEFITTWYWVKVMVFFRSFFKFLLYINMINNVMVVDVARGGLALFTHA
jgi:hypothetical protein